ncbi:MAG: shikimate kinase [Sphingomonas sp.]|nr:shikimate kinase [Sphingomonas sp.]
MNVASDRPAAAPSVVPDRTIVLVGLMGAGKTTVGRRLAARLDRPFVDADVEIEAAAGLDIAEIFERHGEPYFRDGERRVIARLIDGPVQVIATGGGAFVNGETRALILDRAVAVWLDGDIAMLARRIGRRDHRPLVQGKDPAIVLAALAAQRNPFYAEAHVRVLVADGPPDRTVDAIIEAMALHRR